MDAEWPLSDVRSAVKDEWNDESMQNAVKYSELIGSKDTIYVSNKHAIH